MADLLTTPGAPYFALAVAALIIAFYGLLSLDATKLAVAGVRTLPTAQDMSQRTIIGQVGGGIAALFAVIFMLVQGVVGSERLLYGLIAGICYLYGGFVYPRKPLVAAQKERRRLRQLTPGLIAYIRVAMAGRESPAELLTRFVERPRKRILAMQEVVGDALGLMESQRQRPFAALRVVARARGCRELIDLAENLSLAETQGADVLSVLAQQELTLQAILKDEFRRMLRRRTLYLIMLVAVALVIGIVFNILFVMTGGGKLLMDIRV